MTQAPPQLGLLDHARNFFTGKWGVQNSADDEGIEWITTDRNASDQTGYWSLDPDTTWAKILDHAVGIGSSGDKGISVTRDAAATFITMNRCVTLLASITAQLITSGRLRVVDRDRERVTSRRVNKVLDLMCSSLDSGDTPSHTLIEDAVADYGLDGNALFLPSFSMDGMLNGMERMSPWDSSTEYSRDGSVIYSMRTVDGPLRTEKAAARDVIHARWPRLQRYDYSTRSTRRGFAIPPITAMRPGLGIGIQGDRYILHWFGSGSKSNIHFNLNRNPGEKRLTPSQYEEIIKYVLDQTRSGAPVVTQDVQSAKLNDTPQDREARELRDQQVEEVGRFYGVPAPLLGVNITNWGTGIEQLAKLFYRFGGRGHLERFLAPFSLRLLPRGNFFSADALELLRGDAEAIQKLIVSAGGNAQTPPYLTREEIRDLMDYSPTPEGEFATMPATNGDGDGEGEGEGEGDGGGAGDGNDGGASSPPPPPAPSPSRPMRNIKCPKCDKLLGKTDTITAAIEIKCPKCSAIKTTGPRKKIARNMPFRSSSY